VKGTNGSGKSSILRALGYLFNGGTDPSVIRKGAEQSIVAMDLDDGTKIVKTTRPKRARKGGDITGYVADLEITQADGTPRPAPQSYINELGSALAVDPSTLLRIDTSTVPGRHALAVELMKLVPISFAPEEIIRAASYLSSADVPRDTPDAIALVQQPDGAWGLDEIKKAATWATEQRRREGQTKQDTHGAINRLTKALPENVIGDIFDRSKALKDGPAHDAAMQKALVDAECFRREVEKAISDAKLEVEKEHGTQNAAATTAWSSAVAAVNADIDAKIKALEAERTERNTAARDERDKAKTAAQTAADLATAGIDAEATPELTKAIEAVAQAKDAITACARAATLREEIEVQLSTHRAASWKYDQLSEVLQRLEALRLEKLQHLPVAGLVVEDGMPYLDGIEWSNVNTARKVEAVLQICSLQTGKLPLILWDDAEHGDSETRKAIERGLTDAGYQLIEAAVSDDCGLTIEVVE